MENKKTIVSIYLDAELTEWVKIQAQIDNRSVSNWIETKLQQMKEAK